MAKAVNALSFDDVQSMKVPVWTDAAPRAVMAAAAVRADGQMGSIRVPKGEPLSAGLIDLFRGPARGSIVAEGDSWFDYPPGLDLIDGLERRGRRVVSIAHYGDTLENMVYGTEHRFFRRDRPVLDKLLETVAEVRPPVVLVSAGGNDVAGDELRSFLNHADSGRPPLRAEHLMDFIHGFARTAYEKLVQDIWAAHPPAKVIVHGYGHAIPDGRGVGFDVGIVDRRVNLVGPWLRPAFVAKNIPLDEGQRIVERIIDEFNAMLAGLVAKFPGQVFAVDARARIAAGDWVNELHLTNAGALRVAGVLDELIGTVLNGASPASATVRAPRKRPKRAAKPKPRTRKRPSS
jgi:hypothetical protein